MVDADEVFAEIKKPKQIGTDEPHPVDDAIADLTGKSADEMQPIEKYRFLSSLIMKMTIDTAMGKAEYPTGWRPKDLTAVLDSYAKAYNIDPKKALDMRSDADKIADAAVDLLKETGRIFEQLDPILDGYEKGFTDIAENADAYYERLRNSGVHADALLSAADLLEVDPKQKPEEPPSPKVIRETVRRWHYRLHKIKRMARMAANPSEIGMDRKARIIAESTHVLRFQLYAGRPDISAKDSTEKVYQFAQIHVRAAMRIWMARNECTVIDGMGIVEPGDTLPNGQIFEGVRYVGSLIMMPPRHGKTDLVIHDAALTIDLRPRIQMAIIHDREDEASKVLRAVQRLFDPETSQGRRNCRLFPGRVLADYDNNSTTLRVVNDDPPRNANLMAVSVWTSGQGNNLDRIYGDDLVPQSDMTEHSRREQRKVRVSGTWLTRLQGNEWDVVFTGYPRHHEDLMWTYYRESQLANETNGREGMRIMSLRMPVGGPKSKVPFKAIWPEMYSQKELRAKYRSLNDASLWAANYQLEPITSDQRIVEKVRYYDPEAPEIERFMKNATYHLSVDPAAKGDGTGDKAGVVVAALGDIVVVEDTDYGEVVREERMLLFVHAEEFYATQTQLTEHMIAMTSRYPIDTAHIEQVTGLGSAMAEAMETHYGISRVLLHGVANKGKAARLRAVAPLLENSDETLNAKVALPGRWPKDDNGEIIPGQDLEIHPSFKRLESYICNFAVESGYHSLDAATQLIGYLVKTGDLAVHEGEFSREVNKGQFLNRRARQMKRLQEAVASYQNNQPDEYAWFGEPCSGV